MHAYFRLDRPLEAVRVNERTGETIEVIERANAGSSTAWEPTRTATRRSPTRRAAERSQPMRLAGTVNWKTGRYARIVEADFQMTPYSPEALVGDLPDPPWASTAAPPDNPAGESSSGTRTSGSRRRCTSKRSPGSPCRRRRLVRCPAPDARRPTPIVLVSSRPDTGWYCPRLRGAGGAIYDLASVLLGGPCGRRLRGEQFNAPAPTSPTSSANSPDTKQPNTKGASMLTLTPDTTVSRSRCVRSASRTRAAAPPPP